MKKKIRGICVMLLLAELAAILCFPILMAVTGGFSSQWELTQNLAPVLGGSPGAAGGSASGSGSGAAGDTVSDSGSGATGGSASGSGSGAAGDTVSDSGSGAAGESASGSGSGAAGDSVSGRGAASSAADEQQDAAAVSVNFSRFARWTLLPLAPTLESLVSVLVDSPEFFVMFWNSVKIAAVIVAGELVFGIPAAWGLARFSFFGRRAISALYLVLMLMPFQVLMLPQYLVLNGLHLLDSHAAVILPLVFSTFPVFIMERFFRGIPDAIIEAARIDGAGSIQIFFFIGLPLGAPGILSTVILTFLEAWNLIEQPMTFLKTKKLWPLSLFLPDIGLKDAGIGFAAALMMLLPALLVFMSGEEYLEQGIAAAAVKE